jgi:hypothetical protein
MPAEPIRVLLRAVEILDELKIAYLTGGSVASSILGIPRASNDVDIVVDLPEAKALPLAEAMKKEFYIDEDAVLGAVRRKSSFNAIHLETVQKLDFFLHRGDGHSVEEMSRRLSVTVDEAGLRSVYIASAEDIILQKLVWFQMGSRVSERQWQDVLGVVKVQGGRLDRSYLARWAPELGVADLLDEALRTAG